MEVMYVTELVSQLLRGWLKAAAPKNLASERATRGASVSASGGRAHGGRGQYPHAQHVRHRGHVPAAEVLVEGSGAGEPGERASDARSERERECVGAGERTAGEVSTHSVTMFVTELVSQLLRGRLKAETPRNLASERATRGASVSVRASGRASARRARSTPTVQPCR